MILWGGYFSPFGTCILQNITYLFDILQITNIIHIRAIGFTGASMYLTLKEITEGKNLMGDEVTYEIKKFIRKKLNIAFKAYIERDGKYKHLSFKRAKVKYMIDWGIDEYTAYYITEPFKEEIEYSKLKSKANGSEIPTEKVVFPRRGKNIPEEVLMKILGNMNIDSNWFFVDSLSSPVRFLDTKLPKNEKIKDEIIIPVYKDLKQLTELNPLTVSLNRSILNFLGLGHINSNEKHPIFQYYNFVFAKIGNQYHLTNLWDQDLRENSIFLVYKKSDMQFNVLKQQEILNSQNEFFTLGRILTVFEKLLETI